MTSFAYSWADANSSYFTRIQTVAIDLHNHILAHGFAPVRPVMISGFSSAWAWQSSAIKIVLSGLISYAGILRRASSRVDDPIADLDAAQLSERWRGHYRTVRPHSSLGVPTTSTRDLAG